MDYKNDFGFHKVDTCTNCKHLCWNGTFYSWEEVVDVKCSVSKNSPRENCVCNAFEEGRGHEFPVTDIGMEQYENFQESLH
jgi:flavoprotein